MRGFRMLEVLQYQMRIQSGWPQSEVEQNESSFFPCNYQKKIMNVKKIVKITDYVKRKSRISGYPDILPYLILMKMIAKIEPLLPLFIQKG
jgi:hypothetical protein